MLKQIVEKLPQDLQKNRIDRGLDRIRRSGALPFINKIILFGSGARSELTEISDIDFCIILKDGCDLKLTKSLLARSSREEGDDVAYDVLVFEQNTFSKKSQIGGVCQIAEEDGVILYSE